MSYSFSPPRKVLGTPNEIDHVDFYLSSGVPSMMKSSTFLPVKVTETSCPTLSSLFELNNPAPPSQSGPHLLMLSDCLFEGDLPEHRHSESNFLAASENMVIESLTQMREGLINDEGSGFGEVSLESTEPIFDKTPEDGLPLASDSDNTDEVNTLLRWVVQKRMVPVTAKGKEKVIEETPKRKPFTRATNKKFMGDAMKSNNATTKENRRRRNAGVAAAKGEKAKETTKKKAKAKSKEKVEAVPIAKNALEQGPGTKRKQNRKEDTKQDIFNNLRVQKVLGGRVFDPTILKKPGMNSLADLVEIQSWTHLFMTKAPVMHEDQVREFY
ncbi:hypothetical protein KY284_001377 [Solanum tuberosum]|nr:hypothetical protein KY284_001377 [Solanum tuberosum]